MVDQNEIGFPFFVRIELDSDLKPGRLRSFGRQNPLRDVLIEHIRNMREVRKIWFTDNELFDLLLETRITSLDHGNILLTNLKNLKGVKYAEEDINTIKGLF